MELKDRKKESFSRSGGGGGGLFSVFHREGWGFFGVRAVGRGLIRTIALTRRQMASLKVRLKEPYLEV